MSSEFDKAVAFVSQQKGKPSQEDQLALYGLFKCATVGPALTHGTKPSMFDFVGSAKYSAWASLGAMTAEEAKMRYCQLATRVFGWSEPKKSAGGAGAWDLFQGQDAKEAASKTHSFWDTQPMPNKFNEDNKIETTSPPGLIDPDILSHQSQNPYLLDPALGIEWCDEAWASASLRSICESVHELSRHGDQGDIMSFSPDVSFLEWSMNPPLMKREFLVGMRDQKTHELVGFICGLPLSVSIEGVVTEKSIEIKNLFVHPRMRGQRLTPILISEVTRRVVLQGHYIALYTSSVTITKPLCKARFYQRPLNMAKLVAVRFKELARGQTLCRLDERYSATGQEALSEGWCKMSESTLQEAHALFVRHSSRFGVHQIMSVEQFRFWFLDCHPSVHAYVVQRRGQVVAFTSWHVLNARVESNAGQEVELAGAFCNYCAIDVDVFTLEQLYCSQVAQLVQDNVDVMMALDIGGWEDVLLDFETSKAEVTAEYLLYHLYNFYATPKDPEEFNLCFF